MNTKKIIDCNRKQRVPKQATDTNRWDEEIKNSGRKHRETNYIHRVLEQPTA
jgi:hypothetical protein